MGERREDQPAAARLPWLLQDPPAPPVAHFRWPAKKSLHPPSCAREHLHLMALYLNQPGLHHIHKSDNGHPRQDQTGQPPVGQLHLVTISVTVVQTHLSGSSRVKQESATASTAATASAAVAPPSITNSMAASRGGVAG